MPRNALISPVTRLRIVERGGDQLVEIDVLDVEGLAHMGAAGLQQPGDLRLVPRAVELGLAPHPAWSRPG